jgi:hypothetical protein
MTTERAKATVLDGFRQVAARINQIRLSRRQAERARFPFAFLFAFAALTA